LTPASSPRIFRLMVLLDSSGIVPDTNIELHTRANKRIENTQAWQLSLWDWKTFAEVVEKFDRAKKVADACPVYNCHGLIFASRRTAVDSAVFPILTDDGFEEISAKDVRVGDIALYLDERGEASHTGFIIGLEKIFDGSDLLIPKVWSKWGKGPEMVHLVPDCGFFVSDELIKYYRLIHWKDGWRSL
jgi:hypothetical protein